MSVPAPTLTISLVQADLAWEDAPANYTHLRNLIQDCPEGGLILLPEMFGSGFTMNAKKVAEPMTGPGVEFLKNCSKQKNAWVGGSLAIEADGKFYNRFLLAAPDGTIAWYDKAHLFRMSGEQKTYSSGKTRVITDVAGWRVMLQVCYDLRFPVFSRNSSEPKQAYDLLVYTANWPSKRRHHWTALLPARAIENQAFVAGVNRVGIDGNGIPCLGDSMIISPEGEVLAELTGTEGILTAELEYGALHAWREKFPAWEDADKFSL